MLYALLHQLFCQRPQLLKYALSSYDQNGDKLINNANLLRDILVVASADPDAGEVICILDALDGCKQWELKILLQKLCSLYNQDAHRSRCLKSLMTSRPLGAYRRRTQDLTSNMPSIHLAGEENTDQISLEIDLVVSHELIKL